MLRAILNILLVFAVVFAITGCGGGGVAPGGLGDPCTEGTKCASGFCNGDVCSECDGDSDCGAAEACVDDTAGVGYFVCESTLFDLGDDCTDGNECASGFCNGDVCSECTGDNDCAGGGTCVDDTGGVGYFVCEGGLGDLGDACTDGSECASGFCNGNVCSECEDNNDCGAAEACVDDTGGVGYFVCESTLLDLGDACTDGSECTSGFCNGDVCSGCEGDSDCAGGGTCVDDTGGLGYFVCEGSLGDLGDDCADGSECVSGFCNNDVCSECEMNGDCDVQQGCVFDPVGGYAICAGTGDLGDSCDHGGQCVSSFCNNDLCSECEADADCPGGGTCVDDTGGVGYYVCTGGLGDDCANGSECASGFCNNDVCSECEGDNDCDVQQGCVFDPVGGYAICAGTGDLGNSCDSGDQCVSGFCNGNVCSGCEGDADCGVGGTCVDDTGGVGYFVCQFGLGENCTDNADCVSGYCFNSPGPGSWVCSECALDADCDVQQECSYSAADGYAVCVGAGNLGDSCDSVDQCASGFCTGDVCSECAVDADCSGDGTCLDDTGGVGYFVCTGGLGDDCADNADCNSDYCFNSPGPGSWVCSECLGDGDCAAQQECNYSAGDGYAICAGTGGLGDTCADGSVCGSGFCNGDVCSECELDADCFGDGTCVDDTGGVGYFVCERGLGDICITGDDCNSGYCFDPGPNDSICSECEEDNDCGNNQQCNYDWLAGYAVCN